MTTLRRQSAHFEKMKAQNDCFSTALSRKYATEAQRDAFAHSLQELFQRVQVKSEAEVKAKLQQAELP